MVSGVMQASKVDPRVRRTRKLLLDAFSELQKEKSISSISVQDIAERAMVNRATFYAHFEDKYALMYSWMREEFQRVLARKVPVSGGLTRGNLHALALTVYEFLGGFYKTCKVSDRELEPMFETAMQQELSEVLLKWLTEVPAEKRRGGSLEAAAQVVSWAIFGPAVQWSRERNRSASAEEMVAEVLPLVIDGIAGLEEVPQ